MKTRVYILLLGVFLFSLTSPQAMAETRITYQGRLDLSGSPYTGNADMRFQMFDAATSGNPVGPSIVRNAVPVTDGLFQVELDFGAEPLTKAPLWLQVVVDGKELEPRQTLTAAPLAVHALSAANAGDIDGVSAGFGLSGGGGSGTVGLAVDTSEIQRRVASSCGFGSAIRSISATGGVTCEIDDTGALTLPFSGSTSTSAINAGAFEVANTGNGRAIVGRVNYGGTQDWVPAIEGIQESSTGPGHGVQGTTNTSFNDSAGVRGRALSTTGRVYGVYGWARSDDGYGGYFRNTAGSALRLDGVAQDIYIEDEGYVIVEGDLDVKADNTVGLYVSNNSGAVASLFVYDTIDNDSLLFLDGTGDLSIAGSLSQNSDQSAKHDITGVDPSEVLDRVRKVPISTWRYNDDPGTLHMGPMAQDFHATFGLGDDPTGISAIDADGVALAAIQGLLEKVDSQQQRIEALERELATREGRMARRLARLELMLTGNSLSSAQDESVGTSP